MQQAITHELLQPLAVEHVAFAPRDVLDVAGIDQQDGEAARFEQFVQRDPVHAGRFHGDGVDMAGIEPVGQVVQIGGEAGKFAHRLLVSIRRHGHVVRGAADVDSGCVGVGQAD